MIDCPHAARCSGCTRLAQPYDAQLADKSAFVAAALARYPELASLEVSPCAPADPVSRYRTRAKWVVDGGRVGLYARDADHEVVDVPGCVVVPTSFLAVADALRASLSAGDPAGATIRGLDVRGALDGGRERLLVTLVHDRGLRGAEQALGPLAARLAAVAGVVGVALAPRDPGSPRSFGVAPRLLRGLAVVPDEGHIAAFGSFVQAHRGQAERVATLVVEALRETGSRTALDLFGGAGPLGLALARAGADVELVEVVPSAAAAAEARARGEGLSLTARVLDAAALGPGEPARDLVVVDPPRRGLPPALREAVARIARRAIVYVSCDPATLARDLAHLARLGFAAEVARPVDMIPLTDAVEVVAVLRPAPPPPLAVLVDEGDLLVVDKPPHLTMRALEARVRALAPRAIPLAELPPQASGVAPFARSVLAAARLSRELGETRLLARVRGVPRAAGALERARGAVTLSYTRGPVQGGHATVELVAAPGARVDVLSALARIGHPILGDVHRGHAPSNAHFFASAGLDRAYLHATRLDVGARSIASALAPDLVSAGERAASAL